jgi:hypothetical protein
LFGSEGSDLLELAAQTIRSVMLGLLGTAALQAALMCFGFWMAGVPQVLLLGFAVVSAAQAVFAPTAPPEDQGGYRKPLLVLLILSLAVTALETAGFVLTIFVMLLALYAWVERKPLVSAVVGAAVVTGALHVIFGVWLSVPLPLGPFGK